MRRLAALFAVALMAAATMPADGARAVSFHSIGVGNAGGSFGMTAPHTPANANLAFVYKPGNAHQVLGLAPIKTGSVTTFVALVAPDDSVSSQISDADRDPPPIPNDFKAKSTPLPAALPLFASALGAFGLFSWLRRRRAACA